MTAVLIKRDKDLHTGQMSCEAEGRVWGDAVEAKRAKKSPANHQNLGDRQGTDSSVGRTNPADMLMWELLPSRTVKQ